MSELSDFVTRHVGPSEADRGAMLERLGLDSLESLIGRTVPTGIRSADPLALPAGVDEATALIELEAIAAENTVARSLIGQGYHDCHVPSVIRRNVFENPSWYTAYTPYQPEIAQGRLELLFHFQTMIAELTGMAVANASLLDEATAAAEAMAMAHRALRGKRSTMLVCEDCHPQTLDVLDTRAAPLGIRVERLAPEALAERLEGGDAADVFAVLVQYPGTRGQLPPGERIAAAAKAAGAQSVVAADPLALTLLDAPGGWGADIVVGSAQRFGVPMGFGGPHAAYMATTEALRRSLPGRLVGQSITADGDPAWRLALQTREQHIRREKATSNICTAQALLAIMATLYACHHGPDGLTRIARRVRSRVDALAATLRARGLEVRGEPAFDTLEIALADGDTSEAAVARLLDAGFHLRALDGTSVAVSFDETTTAEEARAVAAALLGEDVAELATAPAREGDRAPGFLSQPCFHAHRSETTMMRWLKRLADKDIALDRAMIPLGSCTMKLNAAAEMVPVSWPGFADIHPFAPATHTAGYRRLTDDLERWLAACTGYDAVSLQPNAGSQGEYAGLLAIKRYHEGRGDAERTVCLIPSSAHGTNPASAQMAGLTVVVVKCDDAGNVDVEDLERMLAKHEGRVAAIMITYPSTHGVFETGVTEVCERVHAAGGQVYIDGANLNALVGTAAPGTIRRRRLAPEPAQDVLHPARRGRTRRRPDRRRRAPGAVPAGPPRARRRHRGRQRRPLRQRDDPADHLDVHPHDGRRGPDAGHRDRDPVGQLHRRAPGGGLPDPVPRRARPRGPRVHPGHPEAQVRHRHHGRRHRQAPDGPRLPRPDDELPRRRHADDRAHRERVARRDRPLLRGDAVHPRGGRPGQGRRVAGRRQPARQRPAHGGRADRGRVVAPVLAHRGRLSLGPGRRGRQVLAAGVAHRQRVRRPAPDLHVPAAGVLRGGRRRGGRGGRRGLAGGVSRDAFEGGCRCGALRGRAAVQPRSSRTPSATSRMPSAPNSAPNAASNPRAVRAWKAFAAAVENSAP